MPEYPYNPDIGQTDLMAAAHHGDAEEAATILSMPCDINAQDDHGLTALMCAATSCLKTLCEVAFISVDSRFPRVGDPPCSCALS